MPEYLFQHDTKHPRAVVHKFETMDKSAVDGFAWKRAVEYRDTNLPGYTIWLKMDESRWGTEGEE